MDYPSFGELDVDSDLGVSLQGMGGLGDVFIEKDDKPKANKIRTQTINRK